MKIKFTIFTLLLLQTNISNSMFRNLARALVTRSASKIGYPRSVRNVGNLTHTYCYPTLTEQECQYLFNKSKQEVDNLIKQMIADRYKFQKSVEDFYKLHKKCVGLPELEGLRDISPKDYIISIKNIEEELLKRKNS